MYRHIPVMLEEAMSYLDPKPGEVIADGTLGGGGYSFAIAKKVGPDGRVIAIDLDESAITHAKLKAAEAKLTNISFYHGNFSELQEYLQSELVDSSSVQLSGVVLDLGLSSAQLEDRSRGFSFQADAPLSMAFGSVVNAGRTGTIVNEMAISDLAKIIRSFGEERFALPIAKSIADMRRIKPIETTNELVEAISKAVPGAYRRTRLHFATRTFQALRIATNDELVNLEKILASLKAILAPGARIVIVSFHSLEDRIVKQFFRKESRDCVCPPEVPVCVCDHRAWLEPLTKKAVQATEEEIAQNPRSRSAKLRAARVLAN